MDLHKAIVDVVKGHVTSLTVAEVIQISAHLSTVKVSGVSWERGNLSLGVDREELVWKSGTQSGSQSGTQSGTQRRLLLRSISCELQADISVSVAAAGSHLSLDSTRVRHCRSSVSWSTTAHSKYFQSSTSSQYFPRVAHWTQCTAIKYMRWIVASDIRLYILLLSKYR